MSSSSLLKSIWHLYSRILIPTMAIDQKGNIIEYNDAMKELTGYTHKEVQDFDALMKNIYPDKEYRRKMLKEIMLLSKSTTRVTSGECIVTQKKGEKRYVEFTLNTILNKNESNELKIVQGIDVTKYVLERENLTKMAKKFDDLVEGSRDGWIRTDMAGHFIECNSSFRKMLGYRPNEIQTLRKLKCRALTPIKWHELEQEIIHKQVFLRGYSDVYEKELIKKDGTVFPVEERIFTIIENNKQIGMWGYIRDITDRKKIENSLRESENSFRQFFENNPDYCLIISSQNKISNVNCCALEILGYKKEELIEASVLSIIAPVSQSKVKKILKDAKNGIIINNAELEIITKDQKKRFVLLSVETLKNIYGESSFIWVQRDITEWKKVEKELEISNIKLEEQKTALEQKNIALREIIGQVEIEKDIIKNDIVSNTNEVILPIVEKMKKKLDGAEEYIKELTFHLNKLTSSNGRKLKNVSYKLTPREKEICHMVESCLTNKEISEMLNLSCRTIENHRKSIRKKLGITSKKINMTSFLQHLE